MARNVVFKQADVKRAVKGALNAGMAIGRVEIDPASGRIVILTPSIADDQPAVENAVDVWMAKHAR